MHDVRFEKSCDDRQMQDVRVEKRCDVAHGKNVRFEKSCDFGVGGQRLHAAAKKQEINRKCKATAVRTPR